MFYYAQTDENGVTCVDRVHEFSQNENRKDGIASLAESYPDIVYFDVPIRQTWTITISLELDPEEGAEQAAIAEAMANLADVMYVQAEDGLYRLGSPDADGDGGNAFLGTFLGHIGDAPVVRRIDS